MGNFKILVIAHSLTRNKVAKFGEIVSESQLTSPASELMEAGFIEEVSEDASDNVKKEIKDIKGNKK